LTGGYNDIAAVENENIYVPINLSHSNSMQANPNRVYHLLKLSNFCYFENTLIERIESHLIVDEAGYIVVKGLPEG